MSKRLIIVVVTFLGGVYFFLKFFLPPKLGGNFLKEQYPWTMLALSIMGGVAIGVGVVNIFRVYGRKVVRKETDWLEASVLLAAFVFTTVVGFVGIYADEEGAWNSLYWKITVQGMFMPLGSAIYSLLAFYIVQAAFRAFHVRTVEAALIMTSALLIMLGSLPMPILQQSLPLWLGGIREWVLSGINVGVQRAVLLGSGAAYLIMAVRMWFSLDKSGFASG